MSHIAQSVKGGVVVDVGSHGLLSPFVPLVAGCIFCFLLNLLTFRLSFPSRTQETGFPQGSSGRAHERRHLRYHLHHQRRHFRKSARHEQECWAAQVHSWERGGDRRVGYCYRHHAGRRVLQSPDSLRAGLRSDWQKTQNPSYVSVLGCHFDRFYFFVLQTFSANTNVEVELELLSWSFDGYVEDSDEEEEKPIPDIPCYTCRQPLDRSFLASTYKQWTTHFHRCCYNCVGCKKSMLKVPHFRGDLSGKGHGEDLYCKGCYYKAFGATCEACKGYIEGNKVDAFGKTFHPEHFSCYSCHTVFNGAEFVDGGGFAICVPCHKKKQLLTRMNTRWQGRGTKRRD